MAIITIALCQTTSTAWGQSDGTRNKQTTMHGAAYRCYPETVDLLTKLGADPKIWNHKNKYGSSPFDIGHGKRPGSLKPSPPTLAALQAAVDAQPQPVAPEEP